MDLVFTRDLREIGESSTWPVEAAARRGDAIRVRPGAYVAADTWLALAGRERHLLKMRAAARSLSVPLVFSHESAAALWSIPVVGGWPESVCASYEGVQGKSRRVGLQWFRATWEAGDVELVAGMRTTSLRRTAIDIARAASLARGVAALDHAFAEGVSRVAVSQWMAASRPFNGVRRLETALDIAHGESESPLESLSMARFFELGIPRPLQQHEILAGDGHRYRVDFFWPEFGIVGEADGRGKYLEPSDLWREKQREDAIREVVRGFVRWGWDEAWNGVPLAERLARSGIRRSSRL